jgi:hypothetical protein
MTSYIVGQFVVLTGVYAKEGIPIGVLAVVIKPPSRTNPDVVVRANNGASWLRCRSFDHPKAGGQLIRPLSDEEYAKLEDVFDPVELGKSVQPVSSQTVP